MKTKKSEKKPISIEALCEAKEGDFKEFVDEKSKKLKELEEKAVANTKESLDRELVWAS